MSYEQFAAQGGLVQTLVEGRDELMQALALPSSLIGWQAMLPEAVEAAIMSPATPENFRIAAFRDVSRTGSLDSLRAFLTRTEGEYAQLADTYPTDLQRVSSSTAHRLARLGFERVMTVGAAYTEGLPFTRRVTELQDTYGRDAVRVVTGGLDVGGGLVIDLPPQSKSLYVWRHSAPSIQP
jgi:hypothetical protein